jgi:hypothetical protein
MKSNVEYNGTPSPESKHILYSALEMVKNATGFICNGEFERIEKMTATVGCNEYNTQIYLENKDGGASAYFCNGNFWKTTSGSLVTLF